MECSEGGEKRRGEQEKDADLSIFFFPSKREMKNEEDVALANVSCAKADKDNKTRKQVTSKGKRLLSSFAIATLLH